MKQKKGRQPPRKPPRKQYEAPRLVKIELRFEEALLAGCKIAQQFGPGSPGCIPGGTACRNPTS